MAPNVFQTHQVPLLRASKYYQLASIVILFYDYLITLNLEIETVWKQSKLSLANVLFYCNRYFPILSYIWIITEAYGTSGTVDEFVSLLFSLLNSVYQENTR
ncbi:hypothetical protein PNOK_0715400 [Pyrrhoderma noxium]|uniref:DUF6533 domain-containing protein n=1 Tax=Pyrrhoderma noxium TaxID=2282107 RepID=A0A286UBZ2_9AGAM|nr:hypothetical protein PNOK_0715400 [Pyrrhoderma noxium]